jgi:hypothetical protein
MSFLQRYPHFLEVVYDGAYKGLRPFRRWLRPGGIVERVFVPVEKLGKKPIFDCHMCGQCVLHSTGMTCSMSCPKKLRNGPCGGTRQNGNCEVKPLRPCVWRQAWERSEHMPTYGHEIHWILPPVDRGLRGSAAWINEFADIVKPPAGWEA